MIEMTGTQLVNALHDYLHAQLAKKWEYFVLPFEMQLDCPTYFDSGGGGGVIAGRTIPRKW